jgi:16S rRNA (cytosine1402-N4)-methyltransferase
MKHVTVLKHEAVDALQVESDYTIVDATFGGGGHAQLLCERLGAKGVFVGIDADETAFAHSQDILGKSAPTVHLKVGNFSHLTEILRSLHIEAVDGILADLGWRTDQFTDGGKGFSFMSDDPLQMTYGLPEHYSFTATDIVNEWKEEDIANVLYGYGEERYSRRIARAIVSARQKAPIITAKQLSDIVIEAVPASYRHGRIHPATKSFQALRIAVNDELTVVETFITAAVEVLKPGGRLAVITFHSLEDRITKHLFKEMLIADRVVLVTKKPIIPTEAETKQNPRARSAKLRVIEKLPSSHD